VLDTQLGSDTDAWQLRSDGTYERPTPPERQRRVHQLLIDLAEKRQKEAGRLRRRRPKGFVRRAAE
jgi:polyphosphate kinase